MIDQNLYLVKEKLRDWTESKSFRKFVLMKQCRSKIDENHRYA